MADWDKQLQDPAWNVTLIMPADQVFSVAAAFLLQPGVADARQVCAEEHMLASGLRVQGFACIAGRCCDGLLIGCSPHLSKLTS